MTNSSLSPLKQAFLAIEDLQAKLEASENAKKLPIAVIGIGCRFPGGANNPDTFWQNLKNGVDAIRDVPADRWDLDAVYDPDPEKPGKTYARKAGFLDQVDGFDPQFFGIAPREAVAMDPQQRLLLEVAWEALEHAGIAPDDLSESPTGVFVGIASFDYASMYIKTNDPNRLDAYYGSGISHSIASGRLSYVLGLQGPSISIDTACSSSLVAVHQAVQSLRMGECNLALAGGVNLILLPDNSIGFSKLRMLSTDGRCKTFDARADGFGDGEGCGIVVLKPLDQAIADGDRVLAVIRGSAINQDGPSSGLTAPNGPSQVAVIRAALENGNVQPNQVGYVEAHGTGTSLGDPIEVQALGTVLSANRLPENPFYLASVKTNLGHLEAAAGVAGLIKTILAVQHGEIPPHLNFETPNPLVDWDEIPAKIPKSHTPWPSEFKRRIAGVSAFGFSGTNVHMVVEEPPTEAEQASFWERPYHLLTFSARNNEALNKLAESYRDFLANHLSQLPDIAYTANTGRAKLPNRIGVVAKNGEHAVTQLAKVLEGGESPGVLIGEVPTGDPPKIAFLFTGQGAQYVGMGKHLYETQPIFRSALDRCDEILKPLIGNSILAIIYSDDKSSPGSQLPSIDDTRYTQPAIFAIEYALVELWKSWGISPSAVMGHSVGEYVAAVTAGIFSLEDGLKLIAARGKLMGSLPAGGAMAAVFADEQNVQTVIAPYREKVSIAAVNGPDNVVISGESVAVQEILEKWKAQGIKSRALKVSHAFHSPLMEPILEEFERIASTVEYSTPKIRLISDISGQFADPGQVTTPRYWRDHVQQPVQFLRSIQTLYQQGFDVFVEIGPSPTLTGMGQRCLIDAERAITWVPSLKNNREEWEQILIGLATLFVRGVSVDWHAFEDGFNRRKITLPTYPFQRKRYWLDFDLQPSGRRRELVAKVHPLLGTRLQSPAKMIQFENWLASSDFCFLNDHRVYGTAILPGTGYIELGLAAARQFYGNSRYQVENLSIQEALSVADDQECYLQVILTPEENQTARFEVFSQGESTDSWVQHASGTLSLLDSDVDLPEPINIQDFQSRYAKTISSEDHYRYLSERGLSFGESLKGVQQIWQMDGDAFAEIRQTEAVKAETGYIVHPALLDAHLQVIAAALPDDSNVYLPIHFESIQQFSHSLPVWSHVQLEKNTSNPDIKRANLTLLDETGHPVAKIIGMTLKRTDRSFLKSSAYNDWLYKISWLPAAQPVSDPETNLIYPEQFGNQLDEELERLNREFGLDEYITDLLPEFDRLARIYIVNAFLKLGWKPAVGEFFTTNEFIKQLEIAPQHHKLMGYLMRILEEDKVLRADKDGWIVAQVPQVENTEVLLSSLLSLYPAYEGELEITGRCGVHFAEAINGTADPLQLLFPGGGLETAEKIYQQSPSAKAYNGLVRSTVQALIKQLPPQKKTKVLEIGAGTGGTTSFVLSVLPAAHTDYTFTDISPLFTARAKQKFSQYPFMHYQPLDIEQDPYEQGMEGQQFDLIIAANVIHATADLHKTIGHVRKLLAPNGIFIMLEVTAPQRWVDITFGLTDGWWRFTDKELRPDYPLLSRPQWIELLESEGFSEVITIPQLESSYEAIEEAVIIAQKSEKLSSEEGQWLIVGDADGFGSDFAKELQSAGEQCQVVSAEIADFKPILQSAAPVKGIIHLGDLHAALRLVQALAEHPSNLWLATRGAQAVGASPLPDSKQATLWGLGKVIELEHSELNCRRVDLDPLDSHPAHTLLSEIILRDDNTEVAWRSGKRYAARLTPWKPDSLKAFDQPQQLIARQEGVFESLSWQSTQRRKPGPGEVEIRVHATGLNFKDVMNVLGMYPGDPGPLGGECAGIVTKIGEGVTKFRIGDKVCAVAPGSFQTHVTANADFVVHKPDNLTFEQASSVLIPFTTADFALNHLGKMEPGEKVLIHAGAGGVGQAAIQLALQAKLEVFATAGSKEKRAFLRSMGVEHVMDSRSLTFADETMRITNGHGVNLVLNSLAGEFIPKSLEVLADGGRFLEIGKSGLLSPEQAAQLGRGIQYFVIDWTEEARDEPKLITSIIQNTAAKLESGKLQPLPLRTFSTEYVEAAFRFMQQAKHIGKISITYPDDDQESVQPIRSDGTYLITGGLRGLGLLMAEWLVDRGARHLALLGRSHPTEASQLTLEKLKTAGVQLLVLQGDVSNEFDMQPIFRQVFENMPPLRGIIHAAGILDDGALINQTRERFERVLAPKAEGIDLLHRLSEGQGLDFFILFSSIAAVFGSPGQGNHAAANAAMDALAHYRHSTGLPALSINWGVWAEIGAAADHGSVERSAEQGLLSISPQDGLAILEKLMNTNSPQVCVSPMNWAVFLEKFENDQPAFYQEVAKLDQHTSSAKIIAPKSTPSQPEFLQQLEKTPADRKRSLLLNFVQAQAAKVLGLETRAVNEQAPLNEMGLDSLMAVELRNILGTALALKRPLPVTLVFDYPTVTAISDYLAKEILQFEQKASIEKAQTTDLSGKVEVLDSIEDLSDDDVDRLIAEMSKGKK